MASVAELKKSFFAAIGKVENREDLEKLRVKYLGAFGDRFDVAHPI